MNLISTLFAPVIILALVAIVYLIPKIRDAMKFYEMAKQITSTRAEDIFPPGNKSTTEDFIRETRHIDRCPGNLMINIPNGPFVQQYPACMGCFETFWKERGATIDRRGMEPRKYQGPTPEPVT